MKILKKENKLCLCCMTVHDVQLVTEREKSIFKGTEIEFDANYEYCEKCGEMLETEEMIRENDLSLKDAYRKKAGMLTSVEICSLRKKYDVSQSDLAVILGWGEKTVTRYEGHQVQDSAHDAVLQKINSDPEWYLSLLKASESNFSEAVFERYYRKAKEIYENSGDCYLRKAIKSKYLRYSGDAESCGNSPLDLNKVIGAINHYISSVNMSKIYKTKLIEMLWYADILSYKRNNHSITGLVYKFTDEGFFPDQSELLFQLDGIKKSGNKNSDNKDFSVFLTESDKASLDRVSEVFGTCSAEDVDKAVKAEKAFISTEKGGIIAFRYSNELSLN